MYIVRQIGAGRKQAFGLAKTDEAGRKMISKTLSGRPAIRRGSSYRYHITPSGCPSDRAKLHGLFTNTGMSKRARRTILVEVLAEGFRYENRHYPSLSAIAVAVTGTRWNGLAFFGLTRPVSGERKERRHAKK